MPFFSYESANICRRTFRLAILALLCLGRGALGEVQFSHSRGFYEGPFALVLSSVSGGGTILYTTDGSSPTLHNAQTYEAALAIDTTAVIRATVERDGALEMPAQTHTYLFLDAVLDQPLVPEGYPSKWPSGVPTDFGMEQDPDDLALIAGNASATLAESRAKVKQALLALPTLSIVLARDDMFGAERGIYANTEGLGEAWERAASVELIHPGGAEGFQIDAGIRLQGFTSRDPNRNPKHSFRLLFQGAYGAKKLTYPFFGPSAAGEFDTLVLRSNSQDAWVYETYDNRNIGQFIRNDWTLETQRAMGQPAVHTAWVHLYINGLYWGVYNPCERPDASFAASYFGGEKADYDVLKNHEEAIDGGKEAYRTLLGLIQNNPDDLSQGYRDLSSPDAYEAARQYVDAANLIDYMIHNMYAATIDWPGNNYIARNRATGQGFLFFDWDSEHAFKVPVDINRTVAHSRDADSPTKFHHALKSNADYRMLFADHLYRAFHSGGALYVDPFYSEWNPVHPERNVPAARWMALARKIDLALIAESARWGDYRRDVHPYSQGPYELFTPHNQLLVERERLLKEWFPRRSRIVLEQFKAGGLYPSIEPPLFYVDGVRRLGGRIEQDSEFRMANDPDPAASLVPVGSRWRYRDDGSDQGEAWRAVAFDDSAWSAGTAQLGTLEGDEATIVSSGPPGANYVATYFRHEFQAESPAAYHYMRLRLLRDDGAVVYLNGLEILRNNMPEGPIHYDTHATNSVAGSEEREFVEFPIEVAFLQEGKNVLAVEMHQTEGSSDISFDLELRVGTFDLGATVGTLYYTIDGSDPRLAGGALNASSAREYAGPFSLADAVFPLRLRARALRDGEWSALSEALYHTHLPAGLGDLAITEIHYNPSGPTAKELEQSPDCSNEDFEFIELRNISNRTIGMEGVRVAFGIDFEYSPDVLRPLAPGQCDVLVNNSAVFRLRYGEDIPIAGEYERNLSNSGDRLQLLDAEGAILLDFAYSDDPPWPQNADGKGYSLELKNSRTPTEAYGKAESWQRSGHFGGSPGRTNLTPHSSEPEWVLY